MKRNYVFVLTHISHLTKNHPHYNSAWEASNRAISGFSMKKYGLKLFCTIFMSVICLLNFHSFAEAACGGANCSLVTGSQEGVLNKDKFVMDMSYR